jgi:hypothetical protein
MKRSIVPVLLATTFLVLNVAPPAHAAGCSLASLKGSYGILRQGTLLTSVLGLPAPAPWVEVGREQFDGAGAFVVTATLNIGGVVINATVPGTYTINSDCTGTKTVFAGNGVTVTESIIVIGGGAKYVATDTEPFAVVQGTAERLSVQED